MGLTLSQKIIQQHLVSGEMIAGNEISITIDQTLTQDSTGTMAYLQFESMGVARVKTKLSVAYIDHNTLQTGFENADDHKYIQTVAKKHGIFFSKPGNGICHQVHLERFSVPGQTLLGSDSHTPTCGGIGMLAIGAGGLDVAIAMGGGAYYITMPEIIKVNLTGKLQKASAKDIILEVLRILSVKGGVGKIVEYHGDGVATLSVPERATITNMGAELGATTSIFPSDSVAHDFLRAQGREDAFVELLADEDAVFDHQIDIDLSTLEPMAAMPHSPDNVKSIKDIGEIKVDQVAIGSCTNSSLADMMKVAKILKGRTIHPDVSLVISPGSKQVLSMLAQCGALEDMLAAGARVLECACGPCIGMGQSPRTDAVSLRTFNRNFEGRSGTKSAQVYLVSPETAALSAVNGVLSDPSELNIQIQQPHKFYINDVLIVPPAGENEVTEVVRGPNIKPFPINKALGTELAGTALVKLPDNITTDHIMPSNAKLLPYRSNIPFLSDFCLVPACEDFPKRAKTNGGGMIIAGENYGQGSSREHAALVPLYLGVTAVIAKSFARIHKANLINSGILPLVFEQASEFDHVCEGDRLELVDLPKGIADGILTVKNVTKNREFSVILEASDRQKKMLLAGGALNAL